MWNSFGKRFSERDGPLADASLYASLALWNVTQTARSQILFVAQGDHRIDASGAAGGDVTRQEHCPTRLVRLIGLPQ